jgi:formylglycine-generating enzyme required for sulfatase activity
MKNIWIKKLAAILLILLHGHVPLAAGKPTTSPFPELRKISGGTYVYGAKPESVDRRGPDYLLPFSDSILAEQSISVPDFEIGVTEVTIEQWNYCADAGSCRRLRGTGRSHPKQPATGVSYFDAQAYLSWLNSQVGEPRYSLPTERQWEYAARAGQSQEYWSHNRPTQEEEVIGPLAGPEYNGTARPNTLSPAGSRKGNAFGVHDMLGSVMEWTADCYGDPKLARRGDTAAATVTGAACRYCVVRGANFQMSAEFAHPALRILAECLNRSKTTGFRVVRVAGAT